MYIEAYKKYLVMGLWLYLRIKIVDFLRLYINIYLEDKMSYNTSL